MFQASLMSMSEWLRVAEQQKTPGRDPDLSQHILPSAATMIGICTTLIGLVKIIEARIGPSHVDEYGALTAMLFLASALASYFSIRHGDRAGVSAWCERIADLAFVAGLVSLTLIACLFAYEVI